MKNVLRLIILLLISVVIFLAIRFLFPSEYQFKVINFEKYEEIKKENGTNIIYISGNEPYYIEEFDKILLKIFTNNKKTVYKLDISNEENFSKFLSDIDVENYFSEDNSLTLPVVIIYKDGEIEGYVTYSTESDIVDKLKTLGVE